jgi:hypothetical protein
VSEKPASRRLAEADLDGYWRGRQEALLEAVALAELHGAHVIAKHLRSWYEAGAAARQSAPGRTVTNPDPRASSVTVPYEEAEGEGL